MGRHHRGGLSHLLLLARPGVLPFLLVPLARAFGVRPETCPTRGGTSPHAHPQGGTSAVELFCSEGQVRYRPGRLADRLPGSCALPGYCHLCLAPVLPLRSPLPFGLHSAQPGISPGWVILRLLHLRSGILLTRLPVPVTLRLAWPRPGWWSLAVRAVSSPYSAGEGSSRVRYLAWSSVQLSRPARLGSFLALVRVRCPAGSLVRRPRVVCALPSRRGVPAGRAAVHLSCPADQVGVPVWRDARDLLRLT